MLLSCTPHHNSLFTLLVLDRDGNNLLIKCPGFIHPSLVGLALCLSLALFNHVIVGPVPRGIKFHSPPTWCSTKLRSADLVLSLILISVCSPSITSCCIAYTGLPS